VYCPYRDFRFQWPDPCAGGGEGDGVSDPLVPWPNTSSPTRSKLSKEQYHRVGGGRLACRLAAGHKVIGSAALQYTYLQTKLISSGFPRL
jgi:hypothetical protein